MDMVIHSEIDVRESLSLLVGPLGQPETEKLPFEFVKANYDELLKRLPTGGGFDAGSACCPSWAVTPATRPHARSSSDSSKIAPRSSPAASIITTRCWRASAFAKPRSPPGRRYRRVLRQGVAGEDCPTYQRC